MYPTLSFIIICKDEERVIKRCIDSILLEINSSDELIIIDTGSKDKTKEIISKFKKVNLLDLTWNDDFSEVRNYGLHNAKKDWVFFIDADEVLQKGSINNLKEQIIEIEKIIQIDENIVFSPKVINLDNSVVFNAGRIIKNDHKVFFDGCVHEYPVSINKSIKLITLKLDNVFLTHDGYEKDIHKNKNKAERNTRLIKKILDKDPKNSRYYYFYYRDAKSLLSDKEFENGMENFFNLFPNDLYISEVAKDLAIHYIQKSENEKAEKYIRILSNCSTKEDKSNHTLAVLLTGINEIEKTKKKQKEILDFLILGHNNLLNSTDLERVEREKEFSDLIGYLYFQLENYKLANQIKNSLVDKGYLKQTFSMFSAIEDVNNIQKGENYEKKLSKTNKSRSIN